MRIYTVIYRFNLADDECGGIGRGGKRRGFGLNFESLNGHASDATMTPA
jgi:hypothetical protein